MPSRLKKSKINTQTNTKTTPKKIADNVLDQYIELMENKTFTVIDIETSGLSPKVGGEIIELAAVKVVNGKITDTFESLVEPIGKISKKTTDITGIKPEDLVGQPKLVEVITKLTSIIGNSVLVAHNARFEQLFLNEAFKRLGFAPENEWLCTMKLFRHFHPERKKLGLSAKLNDLTVEYGITFSELEHHRALPDTVATAQAFIEMRKQELDNEFISTELLKPNEVEEDTVVEKEKVREFFITSTRYWEKCYNKKRDDWARRLYVNFSSKNSISGVVYYDLYAKTWVVQTSKNSKTKEEVPVDLTAFEEAFLVHVKQPNVQTYLKVKGVFKKVRLFLEERIDDKQKFIETEYPDTPVEHLGYQKETIPYDTFEIKNGDSISVVYVTNEKRGSRYRLFNEPESIK